MCAECRYFCNTITLLPMFSNLSFYSTVDVIHPKVSCLRSCRVKACFPTVNISALLSWLILNNILHILICISSKF